jgi:hypothetical protein
MFLIYYKVADLDSNTTSISLGYILIGLASLIIIIFLIKYLRKQSVTNYAAEFPPAKNIIFLTNRMNGHNPIQ